MGKVIHWELCKKLKFDHTNKWYMHSPTSVLENETQKLLWDFEIQTDYLISVRRPDLVRVNKKKKKVKNKENLPSYGPCCLGRPQSKIESKRKKKISIWTVEFENERMNGDHPNNSIVKTGQNTKKRHRDMRKLAVTQTPMINYQLTLVWKTLEREWW